MYRVYFYRDRAGAQPALEYIRELASNSTAWHNGGFVLLHAFEKKTQKTPEREKDRARRELADLKERGMNDE